MKFKHAIQVGKNISDIMKLPCVTACHKMNDKNGFEWFQYDVVVYNGSTEIAEESDWIVQGESGDWYVVVDDLWKQRLFR